eukprot:1493798-Rhodomonas_salina.2
MRLSSDNASAVPSVARWKAVKGDNGSPCSCPTWAPREIKAKMMPFQYTWNQKCAEMWTMKGSRTYGSTGYQLANAYGAC